MKQLYLGISSWLIHFSAMSSCTARISSFFVLYSSLLFSMIFPASSLSFSFNFSDPSSQPAIVLLGDAYFENFIGLNKDGSELIITQWSIGQATYKDPFPLWDKATGKVADFTTHFQFMVDNAKVTVEGSGLTFFLSSYPSSIPYNSVGSQLGLFNDTTKMTVAVEFDTYKTETIDPSSDHVGIDVNSIKSVAYRTWPTRICNGLTANAWVSYNAATKNLSVFLTYEDNPIFSGNSSLSYILDLKELLPQNVAIGFSAATSGTEQHRILYWDFNLPISEENRAGTNGSKTPLIIGLATAIGVLVPLMGFSVWFILRRKKVIRTEETKQEEQKKKDHEESINNEIDKGMGQRRFTYSELAAATKNFATEGKLGEGGFGAVYRGFLKDLGREVAIKRISKDSRQGRKEYIAEVNIISQLRHRNLVRLVGWCHDNGDFLLVYELMPNGSLDTYLHTTKGTFLTWSLRYNIALGLASALFYLHEEWESCVVHRDIKPSNVMLDSAFNAKLGDFGLARLVDHDRGSQTTVVAGTMGYMAPEYIETGKASKETDVYSFGVVALELACGRKPIVANRDQKKANLVEWVWDLYGRKAILEAADRRVLKEELDVKEEIERLMIVGLWCAHPDYPARPSIRQAISVLKSEMPLPTLSRKKSVAMYYAAQTVDVSTMVSISSSASAYSTTSSSSTTATGYPTPSSSFWLR